MPALAEVTDKDWVERAARAIYHVEADSFARHSLWCEHSTKALRPGEHPIEWSGNGVMGYLVTVGYLGDRPVCISLLLDDIAGQTVLFYDATSQVVDYKMIEGWFAANLPAPTTPDGRRAHCDAMNFHHCLHAIAEAAEQRPAA